MQPQLLLHLPIDLAPRIGLHGLAPLPAGRLKGLASPGHWRVGSFEFPCASFTLDATLYQVSGPMLGRRTPRPAEVTGVFVERSTSMRAMDEENMMHLSRKSDSRRQICGVGKGTEKEQKRTEGNRPQTMPRTVFDSLPKGRHQARPRWTSVGNCNPNVAID